ncbi:MAG: adenylate/guanylate cyclase domain-containing protein [Methanosarcinaceae archaeon]
MLTLFIEKGGPLNQQYQITKQKTILGRISECDIVLPFSHEISRRHVEIEFREQYYITDLNSANGTKINGKQLKSWESVPLKTNDRITIADEIRLRVAIKKTALASALNVQGPNDGFSNISRVFSTRQVMEAFETAPQFSSNQKDNTIFQVKNKFKLLQILNRVEKELISIQPIDDYLKLVMDLVFEMIPADRGFLMLRDGESKELKAKQIKLRQDAMVDSKRLIQISKTITHKVITENVAIITPDAIIDDRFSDGDSIFNIGIRSVMCVPLWNKDNVLGIIYVDSLACSDNFNEDSLALLIAFANHAAIGIEQARLHERLLNETKIRERLERYHSPEIVDRIIQKDNVKIEASECEVTVLFADIVGFSSMIAVMPPDEISALLNEFYSMTTNNIFRHGGTLDKFIGDNVMAIFGAPIPMQDNAERAVKCALEMKESLAHLNAGKPPERQIQLRMGINTGKVIAGDFGSFQRMEYTVLGETVNTASRLESQVARPGQIVVGELTFQLTKKSFHYKDLGKFKIRGKVEKINVYMTQHAVNDLHIY